MEEGGGDSTVVAPAPPAPTGLHEGSKSAPAESRTRKRVTFDLDLQVHTIPNRIPIYERRPAASTSYFRPQHPITFVPRPLDPKGRDRYLLEGTTTKKITDLFNLPNGFSSYPMPPKAGSKRGGQQGGSTQAMTSASNPYYTFANFRTSKISRAALNLKQITAALGEHFDSNVYKEWEASKRVQSSMPFHSSASSRQGARSASSLINELGVQQTRKIGSSNAIAAFSPSRLRIHHQQPPAAPSQPNRSPTPTRGHYPNHGAHIEIPPSPPESWDRQRLPSVTTEQMSLNSRTHLRRKSAVSDLALYHLRQGGTSPTNGSPVEGGSGAHKALGTARDRPSSRCSTIETYVISDIPGAKQSQDTPSSSSNTGLGARSIGSSAGHRRIIVGPNSRSVAWEAGIALPINESVLSVSTIRTLSATAQDGGGVVQWQVTSRPPNLSI